MRRNELLGALVFGLAGIGWLVFKSEYLRMEIEPATKLLLIAPGLGLLIAAVWMGFASLRSRLASSVMVIGAVALTWALLEPTFQGGWVFYTPYASLSGGVSPFGSGLPYLRGPAPLLTAIGALGLCFGAVAFARRSILGGLFAAVAVWSFACFAPAWWLSQVVGTPRRYAFYYGDAGASWINTVSPIVFGMIGLWLIVRPRRPGRTSRTLSTDHSTPGRTSASPP